MNKLFNLLLVFICLITILSFPSINVNAEKITSVKWGKIDLKSGHIGKVIINKDIRIYKLDKNTNKITKVKVAKKGQEYGVYSKKKYTKHGEMLGIGSGNFIKHNTNSISYKSASKSRKETLGKERVWLRNPTDIYNNKFQQVNFPNLQEAIILSRIEDEYDYEIELKIKVNSKYYTMSYVDPDFTKGYYMKTNPFKKYKYNNSMWNLIKQERIQMGMTENQVHLSWGYPDDINSSVYSWGSFDQWVYDDIGTYLYFDNGKLTSWQD